MDYTVIRDLPTQLPVLGDNPKSDFQGNYNDVDNIDAGFVQRYTTFYSDSSNATYTSATSEDLIYWYNDKPLTPYPENVCHTHALHSTNSFIQSHFNIQIEVTPSYAMNANYKPKSVPGHSNVEGQPL